MAAIIEVFNNIFYRTKTSAELLVVPTLFYMIIQSTSKHPRINPFNISTPLMFNFILLIHSVSLLSNLLEGYKTNKLVSIKQIIGTSIWFVCQTIFKAWVRIERSFKIPLVRIMSSSFMYHNNPTSTFIRISSMLNCLSLLTQKDALSKDYGHVIEQYLGSPVAWKRNKQADKTNRCIKTDFFARL